jgi:hypothetical protein
MARPRDYRGAPDGIVDQCWNPATGKRDLTVRVDGAKLDFFQRLGLPGFREAFKIPDTLRNPSSVLEALDGDFLFFRQFETAGRAASQVFGVRVRPTGWRAFVWGHESADPDDGRLPADRSRDRIRRRVL